MECNNVIKLKMLKTKSSERINKMNSIIKYSNRNYINSNIIHKAQDLRNELEKNITTCDSLLNNVGISAYNIELFLERSNYTIYDVDTFINRLEMYNN